MKSLTSDELSKIKTDEVRESPFNIFCPFCGFEKFRIKIHKGARFVVCLKCKEVMYIANLK